MNAAEARKLTEEANRPVDVEIHLQSIYKVIEEDARSGKCYSTFDLTMLRFANLATRSEVVSALERERFNTTIRDGYLTVEW